MKGQVVNLDLSREMTEMDAEQESHYYWIQKGFEEFLLMTELEYWRNASLEDNRHTIAYSAYTVAELGEMLPSGYYSLKQNNSWVCANSDNTFAVTNIYDCESIYSEADARAKMWIFLKKEKIIK